MFSKKLKDVTEKTNIRHFRLTIVSQKCRMSFYVTRYRSLHQKLYHLYSLPPPYDTITHYVTVG